MTNSKITTEDMTNWLHSQRVSSMNEGNLYEEIIVTIIKSLEELRKIHEIFESSSLTTIWKEISHLETSLSKNDKSRANNKR